jgi:integrase
MAITLYRRHTKACIAKRQKAGDKRTAAELKEDRSYRRCSCPITGEGTPRNDKYARVASGEITFEQAEIWKDAIEARGTWAPSAEEEESSGPKRATIAQAIVEFKADATARNLSDETLKKYRVLFDQLTDFAKATGLEFCDQLTVTALRDFRASWVDKGVSAEKKLDRLKSFGNFCTTARYMPAETPTRTGLKSAAHALRPPTEKNRPTLPYSREMFIRILGALEKMPTGPGDRHDHLERLKLLIYVMRYGGLAIADAAPLTAERVIDGRLFLYRAKTGEPVTVKLPDYVYEPLRALPLYGGQYFFWNKQKATSKVATTTGNWRRKLRKLLALAGVVKPSTWAISHGFRDTFAVEFLKSGGSMEELQILLGHKSIQTTQDHYNPYDASRARKLDAAMDLMHAKEQEWSPHATA